MQKALAVLAVGSVCEAARHHKKPLSSHPFYEVSDDVKMIKHDDSGTMSVKLDKVDGIKNTRRA